MKKAILCFFVLMQGWSSTHAQLSMGGMPMSRNLSEEETYIPVSSSTLPNWEAVSSAATLDQPYLLALFTPSELSFPSSGSFVKTSNGHQVWRAQLRIPGAKAIGLYYDKFQLPEGVQYFVSNANGTQIIGAFTSTNNAASGLFANEAVEGELLQLELDIAPGVDLAKIVLHVDRSAVYFRGIEYLSHFKFNPDDLHELDRVDSALTGSSSVCMINAACPLGSAYSTQRKASFQTLLAVEEGVAACSATMINNTGNTKANCKQYFITATHCDPFNLALSSHFDQIIMRFNFEQPGCDNKGIPVSNTMTGANFLARADYTAIKPTDINGDFLLLELRQPIPPSWNVNLAGWNRDDKLVTSLTAPKKFIGFHHPDGDVKKVSASSKIEASPLDPASSINTHWALLLDSGLASTGSSGSGLFDGDGYFIGIASVAGPYNLPPECIKNAAGKADSGTANAIFYSKLDYVWNYTVDGNENKRKLKPWLDPANTGVVKLNAVKSDCSAITGGTDIRIEDHKLSDGISVYPNPVTGQRINLNVRLRAAADLGISLWDVNGRKAGNWQLLDAQTGTYNIDLGDYSSGVYLLKITDGYTETSKKIVLVK